MHTKTASEIHKSFIEGKISASEIAQAYLSRIHAFDPQIKCFLNVMETKLLEKSALLDRKRAKGEKLGKLAGIPVAIKDILNINGQITTCGSRFLENYKAPFDATVVKLIEQEDGLLVGKTNLDEFAMGSATDNSAFKSTNNPWNLKCVPGGSSGGSAAAVAARLCSISLGSDTGGSIRQPAALCGIVGFKPTYGRVSRYGMVAFGSSLDQIGPFATTVEDTARIMEVLGQGCNHDATSIHKPAENYLDALKQSIKGKKIGVPRQFSKMASPDVVDAFEKSLSVFETLGAELIDVQLPVLRYGVPTYYVLATAEASTNLARFDGIRYGVRSEANTLDEIYFNSRSHGFGKEVKQRILLGTYVLSSGHKASYYRKAQQVRTLFINGFADLFKQVDIIATPTSPSVAFEHNSIKDPLEMYLQDMYTIPANLAGLPAISIPCGFSPQGLPIGLQLTAPQLCDARVLQFAHQFEKASDYNKVPPSFDQELKL
ncbi:MAG: Asp-tRNA(Asn)/Glu-tRNA(Gln) amidotransferase subunit GatA [Chlamydiia bacterium]|nr:Asp-tRNA(Asn)/Glu-tRNA(Gln) amidotransferase subunit GatA [Chlamydiia bacterium]